MQWQKSNPRFTEPIIVTERWLSKIKDKWNDLVKVANNRVGVSAREEKMSELDKLFDIVKCKHKITLCKEE